MIYGITPQGFARKPYDVIKSEIEANARTIFGADIDLSEISPLGAEIAMMALAVDRQWQLAEDVYYSLWLSSAEGSSLDRVTKLGFVSRQPSAYATVLLTFSGTAGSSIPVGTQTETAQGVIFETIQEGVIGIDGEAEVLARCTQAGSSGLVQPEMVSSVKTPVPGIDSVINNSSSTGGRERENDAELRERFALLPAATGASVQAIYSALVNVEGVITVAVFENTGNVVDDNGLPPKSLECVVGGGLDSDVAEMIFAKKPAGIDLFGGSSAVVVDSQGIERTVYFSRPEDKDVYVKYVIETNPLWEEGFSDIVIRNAIRYIGGVDDLLVENAGVGISQPVIAWKLIAAQAAVAGIDSITVTLGLSPDPTESDNLSFLPRERPRTDVLKVEVVVS